MNKAEIEEELKQIIDALPAEDLHEVLICAQTVRGNLLNDRAEAFNRFYDWVAAILKRPQMFGVESVNDLSLVIMGIMFASGSLANIASDFNHSFKIYVNKNHADDFKSKKTDYDWVRLVRLYSSGNKASLELFERWFNDFVELYRKELMPDEKAKDMEV
ncbi:hypothetical protein BDD43_1739 [Mucilaginibacter gracilis]|uniref:Uncharacterized protein n=1 Tax=Mucilaginibacter gracilis TaxID=423350 RepID=A0A495IY09_9SPHI|nr:hypothetical protein [Mucilaginibacter gracilis]RKR81590.1 hypothetical protein BDD43_1739 [Mucilaginibacter gracilis]